MLLGQAVVEVQIAQRPDRRRTVRLSTCTPEKDRGAYNGEYFVGVCNHWNGSDVKYRNRAAPLSVH